jgi:hypothetical protein
MKKIILSFIVLLLLAVLFMNGCEREMTIKEIHEKQEELINKEVITSGIVERSTQIFSYAAFLLGDGTGENSIWVRVASGSMMPEEGMEMRVKGFLIKEVTGYHIIASEVKQIE